VGGQMNLLAAPLGEAIEVPLTPAVLHAGAAARAEGGRGEPLFAHRFEPPWPPGLVERAYELGGDPSRLESRSEYMRDGIGLARSGSASA
jgi:hypothetical protein